MSSSPFEIFRRNLKPLMILLTALAMFAFVVLPVLDTYMRRGAGGVGGDEVVARYGNVQLTRARVAHFTQNHQSTVRFLRELAESTIAEGGMPSTAGFSIDPESGRIQSLGINERPNENESVRILQFAAQATKAGFSLDDSSIKSWLEEFTNGIYNDKEIGGMLMESTRNRMGPFHLFEQLRTHLLAQIYVSGFRSTLLVGRMPLDTPAEQWDTFLKLQQGATIDAYGILVSDYLSETEAEPSEAVIEAVYEDGKDRDPNPQSPLPAFHKRYAAKFEYLVGDYKTFLDAEMKKISEEDLRKEYEAGLAGGAFQLPEGMTDPSEAANGEGEGEDEETGATPEGGATEAAETEAAETEAPAAETEAAAAETEAPAAETEAAAAETEAAAAETEAAAAETEAPAAETEAPAAETEAPAADAQPEGEVDEATEESDEPDDGDQSRVGRGQAVRLVTIQQDEGEAAAEAVEEAAEAVEEASEGEPAPQKADGSEAPEGNQEETDAEPATDEPATDETAPATDGGDVEAATADEKPAPAVESFEDVRDQIAARLARPNAEQAMRKAMQSITVKMKGYARKRMRYENDVETDEDATVPDEIDLAKIGEDLGFRHVVIGFYDAVSIVDEPIAESTAPGATQFSAGPSFAQMMFGDVFEGQMIQPQGLYQFLQTSDQTQNQYISWKIDEKEAATPKLEDVRDDVIMAVRMKEARKLAEAAAEELAKKANESPSTPLAELVPEDKKALLFENQGPFKWLNQIGFQGANLGNVPDLDSVGDDFMKAVFTTQPGKFGSSLNQPQSVAYVIKTKQFEPSLDELRAKFKLPNERIFAMMLGGGDTGEIIGDYRKAVDEESGFESYLAQPQQ